MERERLTGWLAAHTPDVLIFVHHSDMLARLRAVLREQRVRVPGQLGVAVLSHLVEGTGFAGLQQNQQLAARIANRDFGIPANPRIEMVESEWIPGHSLRPARKGQRLT